MLYAIEEALAEDDGTAWKWDNSDFSSRHQVKDLSIVLLRDGLRAVLVGTEVAVDVSIADIIQNLTGCRGRRVTVRGPQPQLSPRPDMLQLGASGEVHLASGCVERDPDGRIKKLTRPFLLAAGGPSDGVGVFKIAETRTTVFSGEIKNVLAAHEPGLRFVTIGFEENPTMSPVSQTGAGGIPNGVVFWESMIAKEIALPEAERDAARLAHMRSRLEEEKRRLG